MLGRMLSKVALFLIGLILCMGCSKLRKSWTAEGYQGKSFSKLAVFSINTDTTLRRVLEETAIDAFSDKDINVLASSNLFATESFADSLFEETLGHLELDGVLTVSLLVSESENSVLPEDYNKFSKFYALRFTQLNTQRYLTKEVKYVMEGVLYDLSETENIVWRGEMALLDPKSLEAKKRFLKRMIEELTSKGLVLKVEN